MNSNLSIPVRSAPIDWRELPPISFSNIQWTDEPDRAPHTFAKAAFVPGEGLTLRLYCGEESPKAAITQPDGDIYTDSCLEFFCNFAPEKDSRYVNFEVNALGTMHCAIGSGRHGRRFVRDMVGEEQMPAVRCGRDGAHWWVQFTVTEALVQQLYGKDTVLRPGSALKGNFYKSGECCDPVHFLLWRPVDTQTPDYHRPEYFGDIIIEQQEREKNMATEERSPLTLRINELAKKAKTVGLTPEEKAEQARLRTEYLAIIRANFTGILDNTVIVREDGTREKVSERKKK